jgi:hypothetical protein
LQAFNKILEWGDLKPSIVAQMASNYYSFWSKLDDASVASLVQYKSEFIQLLIYGPIRDRDDQKMDGALLLKSTSLEEIAEADGYVHLATDVLITADSVNHGYPCCVERQN